MFSRRYSYVSPTLLDFVSRKYSYFYSNNYLYKLFCKKVTIALNVTVKNTTQYYPFRKKLTFFLEGIATLSEMKLKNQLFRTEFDFTYEITSPTLNTRTPNYAYRPTAAIRSKMNFEFFSRELENWM